MKQNEGLPRPAVATLLSGSVVDVERLHEDVAARGIDAVREDLRPGGRFVEAARGDAAAGEALRELLAVLDALAPDLKGWRPDEEPGFFLQQLRNRCFERGLWEVQARAERVLSTRGWPHLRERVRTDRGADARVRTLPAPKDQSPHWHDTSIGGVALTPDGRLAVSGSHDRTVRVWDLRTGQLVRTMKGHSDEVRGVAVSGDGRVAVSASIDRTVRVWSLESGDALCALEGHGAGVWGVAITPDGRSVVSASMDGKARVWSVEGGEARLTFERHRDAVLGVAVSPDGRRVVSGAMDGTVLVWELATGEVLCTLRGHSAGVWSVDVGEDGKWAVSGSSDRTVILWDLERGAAVDRLEGHTAEVSSVRWMGDAWAMSGSLDGTIRVWDLSAGRSHVTWTGRGSAVAALDVGRDRRLAVSGSRDGAIEVWSLEGALDRTDGRPEAAPATSGPAGGSILRDVAVCPGGRWAAAAAADGSIQVVDLLGDAPPRSFAGHRDADGDVRDVRMIRVGDGGRVAAVSYDGTVTSWDAATGSRVGQVKCAGMASQVALTADASRAVAPGRGGAIEVWDLVAGQVVSRIPDASHTAQYLAVSGDGRRVLTVFWGPIITTGYVWDVGTGTLLRSFSCGSAPLAVSHDGRRALIRAPSYNVTDRVDVWDLDRGVTVRTLHGGWQMALSRDGRWAASADGEVVVLDTNSGALRARARSQAPFSCCAFTPDGRTIVAGDKAGGIHLLDEARTGG